MNSRQLAFVCLLLVVLGLLVLWAVKPLGGELPLQAGKPSAPSLERSAARAGAEFEGAVAEQVGQALENQRVEISGQVPLAPGRRLLVTDMQGAPLGGAELAIVASREECLLHVQADEAGVITIVGDAPKGDWYVSAPGKDVLMVKTGAKSVKLDQPWRVLVSAVDSIQGAAVEGLTVRPAFGGDAPGCFEWVAAREGWQVLTEQGQVFEMREGEMGTAALNFFCQLAQPCELLIDSWYLESRPPMDPQRADADLVLFVEPHVSHVLPEIVFREANEQPVVDARVWMRWDDLTLREMQTDANGAIWIDLHVLDEMSPLAPFRFDLTTADGREWTCFVASWDLRKKGRITIDLEAALVELQLNAPDPTAFAAAMLAEHPYYKPQARGPMSIDALKSHGRKEFLRFTPFEPDGTLSLGCAGERGDRCVVIQHRESGILVGGSCFVQAGDSLELDAPEIGQIEYRGNLAALDDGLIEYSRPRAPLGCMSTMPLHGVELKGRPQTFAMPYGTYMQQITLDELLQDGTELTIDQPHTVVELDLPELVTVQAHLRSTLGARLNFCFIDSGLDNQQWSLIDENGDFTFKMPADWDRNQVWMSLSPGAYHNQRVAPVWLDAHHVEIDFGLAQLDVFLGGSASLWPFLQLEFLATDGAYFTDQMNTVAADHREVTVPAGEYEISLELLNWTQTIQLHPGERLAVNVPAFEKGLVAMAFEAPQWTSVYVEVHRGETTDGDGELQLSTFVNHIAALPPFAFLDAGRYTLVLSAESDLPDGSSSSVEVTRVIDVHPGEVTNETFALMDALRENANR